MTALNWWYITTIFFISVIPKTDGVNILAIFPVGAKSHFILGNALLRGLVNKGHNVTMISPFHDDSMTKNSLYNEIVLTGFAEEHEKKMQEVNVFQKSSFSNIRMIFYTIEIFASMTEGVLRHNDVQKLMKSDSKFDLVIVEEVQLDALKALAYHFNAPLVVFSSLGANPWVNNLVGNPNPLAYVPNVMMGIGSNMSFLQKVGSVLFHCMQTLMREMLILPQQRKLAKKYIPNDPNVDEIIYNTSLVLLNSHSSINQAVPYVPTMIDIGGFHINAPKKLHKEFQDLLDNASDGFIYFSLGSHLKSSFMPQNLKQILLNTFSNLKETVLWKWEEDELEGKSKNVHISKWMPQQDILAHKNLKLFITHSGLLSTLETLYYGVPVLAFPLAGDQQLNAQSVVDCGIGLKLTIQDVTESKLLETIRKLLTDPKFSENAKQRSRLFHDRQVSPMDTATYWVEYVLRHGTTHMRVAGVDLPWYQYHLLDIIGFLIVLNLMGAYIVIKVVQKICLSRCKNQKNPTRKLKKK